MLGECAADAGREGRRESSGASSQRSARPVQLIPILQPSSTTPFDINPPQQDIFRVRSKIVAGVRRYLDDRGFLEVRFCLLRCCLCCWGKGY